MRKIMYCFQQNVSSLLCWLSQWGGCKQLNNFGLQMFLYCKQDYHNMGIIQRHVLFSCPQEHKFPCVECSGKTLLFECAMVTASSRNMNIQLNTVQHIDTLLFIMIWIYCRQVVMRCRCCMPISKEFIVSLLLQYINGDGSVTIHVLQKHRLSLQNRNWKMNWMKNSGDF